MFATLAPWEERERSQQEIVDELREPLARAPRHPAPSRSNLPAARHGFGGTPVSLVAPGPGRRRSSRATPTRSSHRAQEIPGFVNVADRPAASTSRSSRSTIDRDRASDLGVSVRDIATTLQILLGGARPLDLQARGRDLRRDRAARARRARAARATSSALYVRGDERPARPARARSCASRETVAPRGVPHFDRLRAATVTASLAEGAPLGEALERIARASPTRCCADGPGYRVTLLRRVGELLRVGQRARLRLPARACVDHLPRAGGAVRELRAPAHDPGRGRALVHRRARRALARPARTLNLFSQIGLVMLVGLVTKNSILIVEFANQLRERGHGPRRGDVRGVAARASARS